ncbi:M23 family metallopeptidase [Ramlibacter sp. H39-3-26]|nr:M23 family metallopeptidase [Ramlibacter sp. H39-3-26]MDF1486457.1 M23 family metallopeptidase [Ramlibacter sp. H39-3-26]
MALGLQRHPKRVTAALAALLLCGGGGAFALASLAPDPVAGMVVREIIQSVEPLAPAPLADDVPLAGLSLYRSDLSRATDTADALLQRLGVSDPLAAAFLRGDAQVRQSLLGRVGRAVTAEATAQHELQRLTARWVADDTTGNFQRLVVERTPQGFASRIETAALTASSRLASGTIESSLYAATDASGIPDAVASQVAEVFANDIDFRRALRKGDRFAIVYETLEGDGEPLRAGRVLSAEFVNNGKSFQALWFQEPGAPKGAYYTLDGQSLQHAYLSAPLAFTRVTSNFSMRLHPILQTWRAHLGTDFGAPTGTPVRTVGDGVVQFAGVQNGYGNVIFVKHRNSDVTVYAHLSRIDVKPGQHVGQGDIIGAVGMTGWATGPHLHFEFRVNGMQKNPLAIARQSEAVPIPAAAKPQFDRLAAMMRIQLDAAASVQQASAQ